MALSVTSLGCVDSIVRNALVGKRFWYEHCVGRREDGWLFHLKEGGKFCANSNNSKTIHKKKDKLKLSGGKQCNNLVKHLRF